MNWLIGRVSLSVCEHRMKVTQMCLVAEIDEIHRFLCALRLVRGYNGTASEESQQKIYRMTGYCPQRKAIIKGSRNTRTCVRKRTHDSSPGRIIKKSKNLSCTSKVAFMSSHDNIPEDQFNQENETTVCRITYLETLFTVLRIEEVSFFYNLEEIEKVVKEYKERGIKVTLDARLVASALKTTLITLLKPEETVEGETESIFTCFLIRILREIVEKLIDSYPACGFEDVLDKIWEETRKNDEEADRIISNKMDLNKRLVRFLEAKATIVISPISLRELAEMYNDHMTDVRIPVEEIVDQFETILSEIHSIKRIRPTKKLAIMFMTQHPVTELLKSEYFSKNLQRWGKWRLDEEKRIIKYSSNTLPVLCFNRKINSIEDGSVHWEFDEIEHMLNFIHRNASNPSATFGRTFRRYHSLVQSVKGRTVGDVRAKMIQCLNYEIELGVECIDYIASIVIRFGIPPEKNLLEAMSAVATYQLDALNYLVFYERGQCRFGKEDKSRLEATRHPGKEIRISELLQPLRDAVSNERVLFIYPFLLDEIDKRLLEISNTKEHIEIMSVRKTMKRVIGTIAPFLANNEALNKDSPVFLCKILRIVLAVANKLSDPVFEGIKKELREMQKKNDGSFQRISYDRALEAIKELLYMRNI
ncbi:hypothetical protein GCK72_020219 [Caenorhabditis remanei]|uniref:SPK domain-containing protein n=1 Tax=Caenorhabditis remanei TaxID=31234 RepID=A0A6A5GGN3_CAERE|nr:hypothetical protein GCK72_020219 [Caenorhabditis remanei]KAF1753662.1 hypothetical protein GCK72_020219 [Caenorhabditis remanei]